MNTRLQVEHPVTELVYGVDLVEHQLRLAAGEPLALRQHELVPRGHAVEARLYAEDPANGFLPATGTVRRYREPAGVRVDSGVRERSEVSTSYDPMLAKVIAYAPDRRQALGRLDRALAELELVGVITNAAFTRGLLARDDVRAGEQDTGLLERVLAELAVSAPEDLLLAGALAAAGTARPAGPWRRQFEQGTVRIHDGHVDRAGRTCTADIRTLHDGAVIAELDGVARRYAVMVEPDVVFVARDRHHLAARTLRKDRSGATALAGSLEAPMPGAVLQVRVDNGDRVQEGDVLLVLESMKMELSITAPHEGIVAGLELRAGDRVDLKQPLVAVSPQEDT